MGLALLLFAIVTATLLRLCWVAVNDWLFVDNVVQQLFRLPDISERIRGISRAVLLFGQSAQEAVESFKRLGEAIANLKNLKDTP